jgi:hypothetical protein
MTKPTVPLSIAKPTVQQVDKQNLLDSLAAITRLVVSGEIEGMIAVVVRADRRFAVYQSGHMNRIEAIGFVEQAKHDLLMEEKEE